MASLVEFRAALAGPIAALAVVVLARSSASWWVWALGIAGIVAVLLALNVASLQARDRANTAIANGILAGKIKPLALQPEQVRRWNQALHDMARAKRKPSGLGRPGE
jgi:hypothetical protein